LNAQYETRSTYETASNLLAPKQTKRLVDKRFCLYMYLFQSSHIPSRCNWILRAIQIRSCPSLAVINRIFNWITLIYVYITNARTKHSADQIERGKPAVSPRCYPCTDKRRNARDQQQYASINKKHSATSAFFFVLFLMMASNKKLKAYAGLVHSFG